MVIVMNMVFVLNCGVNDRGYKELLNMREIRFRAWNKKEKKMYWYSDWSTLDNKRTLVFENEHEYVDSSDYSKEVELMQFTGLTDKNGKEIYCGDLMNLKDKENKNIGEVYFDEQWCAFKLKTHVSSYWMYEAEEIIGNVFENKELLKRG